MANSLTILIATAGKHTLLDKTLDSLNKCNKPANYAGTIIVENGIKYAAEDITKKYQHGLNAKYLYLPRGNKSAALNYALGQIVDNTLIFFSDDDMYIDENVLCGYAEMSKGTEEGFYYGGPMFATYEKVPPGWLIDALPASAKGWQPNGNTDYVRTPRFLGCNWAAFSGDLKKAGGFNENLGPGTKPKRTGQEWDMQERLLAQGIKAVYVEEAKVWHYVPKDKSSFGWLLKRRYQGGTGRGMQFVEKYGKRKFPAEILKYFLKSVFMLFICLFSFSRKKWAVSLGDFSAALGRIKGYYMEYTQKTVV